MIYSQCCLSEGSFRIDLWHSAIAAEQAILLDIATDDQSSAWLSIDVHKVLYTRQIFNTGQ